MWLIIIWRKNMIKDYFINSIENAIELAIKDNKLGSMTE